MLFINTRLTVFSVNKFSKKSFKEVLSKTNNLSYRIMYIYSFMIETI